MAHDGSSHEVTIPAIGLARAAGESLRKAVEALPTLPGVSLLVSIQGIEVPITTTIEAAASGPELRVATLPASRVRLCGFRDRETVAVSADGGVSEPGGEDEWPIAGGCISAERTLPVDELAFDDVHWRGLRGGAGCEAEKG